MTQKIEDDRRDAGPAMEWALLIRAFDDPYRRRGVTSAGLDELRAWLAADEAAPRPTLRPGAPPRVVTMARGFRGGADDGPPGVLRPGQCPAPLAVLRPGNHLDLRGPGVPGIDPFTGPALLPGACAELPRLETACCDALLSVLVPPKRARAAPAKPAPAMRSIKAHPPPVAVGCREDSASAAVLMPGLPAAPLAVLLPEKRHGGC